MSALVGLPALPAAVCPSAAGALAGTGLGTVCTVANGVSGTVGSAVGSVVGFGVGSVLDAVSGWVTGGAVWLLGQIGGVLSATTAVDLGAPWFAAHYATMVALAGVVILPLLLLGVLQALYRQSAAMLLRSVLVHVPLAVLLTAVAVSLVQTGLAVTDSLCAAVSQGAGLDAGHFMATVTTALAPVQGTAEPGSAPTFVLFLGGIAVVVGAVMIWLELLLRSAAVYVAVLFLPLALAGLAWPAISHWSRRLVDTLAALVLSKLVIVAVLSLAAGALAGGTGSTPTGAAHSGGGFASVLAGAALLLLAAFAPWSLFRLLPFLEAGAVGHLEGLGQRARNQASVPVRGLANVALRSAMAGSMAGSLAAGGVGVMGPVAGRAGGGGRSGGTAGSGGADPSGGPGGGGPGGGGPAGRGGADDDVDPYKPADWAGPQPWEPGGSIRMMPPHPSSPGIMRRMAETKARFDRLDGEASHAGPVGGAVLSSSAPSAVPPTGPSPGDDLSWVRPGLTYVGPLPRATGAREADHRGRDHLGPVLIAGSRLRDRPGRTGG